MTRQRDVTLWPTRENYQRFRELCDDEVAPTFDHFEKIAGAAIRALMDEGIKVDKIAFNPDRMAQWCRANYGGVNAEARAAYVAVIALAD